MSENLQLNTIINDNNATVFNKKSTSIKSNSQTDKIDNNYISNFDDIENKKYFYHNKDLE